MRLQRVREALIANELDAFVVTNHFNRYYISNFSGSSGCVLITLDNAYLITDFRYKEQAPLEVTSGMEIVIQNLDMIEVVVDLLKGSGINRVGFESSDVTYSSYRSMTKGLSDKKLVPIAGLIEKLRSIKDEYEIEKIERACAVGDEAFSHMCDFIEVGMTEKEVSIELETYLLAQGLHTSFATIVASGVRGAMPHATPSDKLLEVGDYVTLDFGCIKDYYVSDMTRTIALGVIDAKQKSIYETVLFAQQSAIEAIKVGVSTKYIDGIARKIIDEAGYSEYFGHGLGHGVGLEVHETPNLSPRTDDILIEPGMVFSIEPGIYIPNWGGVRIEDLIAITYDTPKILTKSRKEIIYL